MSTRHYDLKAWGAVMTPQVSEASDELVVEGDPGLSGSYVLNGPAMVQLDGKLMHPFDGHGFIRAVRFSEEGARLQTKFVDTPVYRAEAEAGRVLYRGVGSSVGGWWSNLWAPKGKNTANTCVVPWAGRLLALNEGGFPYAMDPETLETTGLEEFGGAFDGLRTMLAHTRWDVARDRLVMAGLQPGPKTGFTFVELDRSGASVARRDVKFDGMIFVHDFLITPSWYVIVENPVDPNLGALARFMLGAGSLVEGLRCSERHARILLIAREGDEVREVDLGRRLFSVHHGGAWEEGEDVVLDTTAFESFKFGAEFGYGGPDAGLDPGVRTPGAGQKFQRFRLKPDGAVEHTVHSDWAIDFPRIHPRLDGQPYRYVWAATSTPQGANDPFTALIGLDLEAGTQDVWESGPGRFVGEPVFAPTGEGEADGRVLVMIYDGLEESCRLGIFDPKDIAAGPVATVQMPRLLPYGFHGNWIG
jgi:carotenoid cleavage dioxygenase-like enzyme